MTDYINITVKVPRYRVKATVKASTVGTIKNDWFTSAHEHMIDSSGNMLVFNTGGKSYPHSVEARVPNFVRNIRVKNV